MSDRDYELFKRCLGNDKQIPGLICLQKFIKPDGAYFRRDFIHPRNVRIVDDKFVVFEIENWVTLKSMEISVNKKDICYFEFVSKDSTNQPAD